MINCFQFCFNFAFKFNLRRYIQEFHELSFLYFCHDKRKFALSRNWPKAVPCTAALWLGHHHHMLKPTTTC